MAEIIRPDFITTADLPPDQILEENKGWDQVLLLGYKDGEFLMAGSSSDIASNVLLCERFKFQMLYQLDEEDD